MSWPSIPPPPPHDRGEVDLSGQGSAGAAAPAPTSWGPGQVALGVLALLLISVIEALIVSGFDPTLDSLAARLSLQAMLAATLIAIAFVASSGGGFRTAGCLPPPRFGEGVRGRGFGGPELNLSP